MTVKLLSFAAFLAAILFWLGIPARATTCAPEKLVHIAVADATPGIDAASFAAQPKNYYRIGSDKLRIEEALDAPNGIHGLVVVSEPNVWMANLYDSYRLPMLRSRSSRCKSEVRRLTSIALTMARSGSSCWNEPALRFLHGTTVRETSSWSFVTIFTRRICPTIPAYSSRLLTFIMKRLPRP